MATQVREKLREAVHIAAELTDSDPETSDEPYALVAVAILSLIAFWAVVAGAAWLALKRRLGKFYSPIGAEKVGPGSGETASPMNHMMADEERPEAPTRVAPDVVEVEVENGEPPARPPPQPSAMPNLMDAGETGTPGMVMAPVPVLKKDDLLDGVD